MKAPGFTHSFIASFTIDGGSAQKEAPKVQTRNNVKTRDFEKRNFWLHEILSSQFSTNQEKFVQQKMTNAAWQKPAWNKKLTFLLDS